MKNVFKQKNSLLMLLFGLVLIMGIGFAAYSQQLKITDTSSIITSWDVYIKSVDVETKKGGATGTGVVNNKTTANLITNLQYPGDSVVYKITLRNGGSSDAVLRDINLQTDNPNTVIKYKYVTNTGVETENSNDIKQEINELNSNDEKSFRVKVEYDKTMTGTATETQKSNSLKIDIDYDSVEG